MFLTKKQLEEIRRALADMGVRDTDLPDASALTGAELVAIVQGNENRKVAIGDLFGKYLEDLLPYAVRGLSAYEVAVENGFTGTVDEWLASLQAGIEIDNNFEGGIYKVASAEEAKALKTSLDRLLNNALTKDDVVNSVASDATNKPLSAAMGKYLMEKISSLSPGGSAVTVYDGLDSTSKTDALSANQGRVLKELVNSLVALNNGIKQIYSWAEFQTLRVAPVDTKDSVVNVRVAYELRAALEALKSRVAALEGKSDSGSSDSDTEYVYTFAVVSDDDVKEINAAGSTTLKAIYSTYTQSGEFIKSVDVSDLATWQSSNTKVATVSGGVVTGNSPLSAQAVTITASYNNSSSRYEDAYELTVRKVGGDDQPAALPYITINPSGTISVTPEGRFDATDSTSVSKDFEVTINNSSDSWKIADGQNFYWFTAEKVAGTNALRISGVNPYFAYDNGRTAPVTICLESDETVVATVTMHQIGQSYSDIDFLIKMQNSDARSYTFPAIGGEILLAVQAPQEWVVDMSSLPSWVSLSEYTMNSSSRTPIDGSFVGAAGETIIRATVTDSETDHASAPIIAVLQSDSTTKAMFYVAQDTSLSDVIRLRDTDGMNHAVFGHYGRSDYGLKLTASGNWTATVHESCRSWLTLSSGTGYTLVNTYTATGTSTGASGISLNINVTDSTVAGGRVGGITASLDDTDLLSICTVAQVSDESMFSAILDPVPAEGGETKLTVFWNQEATGGGIVEFADYYLFLDREGYSVPDYVHFKSENIFVDSWGWHEARPANGSATITGITVDALPEGETSRTIELSVNLAKAGLETGTIIASVVQAGEAEQEQDSSTPIVNTLRASISGSSDVSKDGGNVTISIVSDAAWDAVISGDNTLNYSSSDAAGATTASIIATVGANTGDARNITVTITSRDENCVPRTASVTISQAASITYTVPDSVTIPSGASEYGRFTLKSSEPWSLSKVSGNGLFTGYRIAPSSGNATTGTGINIYTDPEVTQATDKSGQMSFIINGETVKSVRVVKSGVQQTYSIAPASGYGSSMTLSPNGSNYDRDYVLLDISPVNAEWLFEKRSGSNEITIYQDTDSTTGKPMLEVRATPNTSASERVWVIRATCGDAYYDFTVTQEAVSLTASPSQFTVLATGTESERGGVVNITSNSLWTASSSDSSVLVIDSITDNDGVAGEHNGNGSIAFHMATNSEADPRTATITVTSEVRSAVTVPVTVNQSAGAPAAPVFSTSNNLVTITCSTLGAQIYYKRSTDTQYSVYSAPIAISADTDFVAYSKKNNISSSTVSYSAQYDGGSAPVQTYLTLDQYTMSLGESGGTATIHVSASSNITWSVDASPELLISTTHSHVTGDADIVFTYPTNYAGTAASYYVTVSADDTSLGVLDQTCNITQAASTAPVFTITDRGGNEVTQLDFDSSTTSRGVSVTATAAWTLENNASWLSASVISGNAGTTTVTFTKTATTDNISTVVFVSGSTRYPITVTQGMQSQGGQQ